MKHAVFLLATTMIAMLSGQEALAICPPKADTVEGWAFAKVSPVPISQSPGQRRAEDRIPVEFGVAYPVVNQKGKYELRICIGSQAVWSNKVNFFDARRRRWIETTRSMEEVERPVLEFWESQDRLRIYLDGLTGRAPPDYREPEGNSVSRELRLPLIRTEAVQVIGSARIVEVANVLLPFPMEAVSTYREIFDGAREATSKIRDLALVVDISGSTSGFVGPVISRFANAAAEVADMRNINVASVGFGGNGVLERREPRPLLDDSLADWPVAGAVLGSELRHDIKGAIDSLVEGNGDAPLLILAGGDIALSKDMLQSFSNIVVGQVTPELDYVLQESAHRLGLAAYDYSANLGEKLASVLAERLRAAKEGPVEKVSFVPVIEIMREERVLPVLPVDVETNASLAITPVGAERPQWFAIQLWLVVRSDLVRYVEE